jgi:hypothetical protein
MEKWVCLKSIKKRIVNFLDLFPTKIAKNLIFVSQTESLNIYY